jgi:hypothetical protein
MIGGGAIFSVVLWEGWAQQLGGSTPNTPGNYNPGLSIRVVTCRATVHTWALCICVEACLLVTDRRRVVVALTNIKSFRENCEEFFGYVRLTDTRAYISGRVFFTG